MLIFTDFSSWECHKKDKVISRRVALPKKLSTSEDINKLHKFVFLVSKVPSRPW